MAAQRLMRRPFSGRGGSPINQAATATQAVSTAAMPDRAEIARGTNSAGTYDLATHTWAPGTAVLVYRGPARCLPVAALTTRQQHLIFGDTPEHPTGYVLALPLGDEEFVVGDQAVLITSIDPTLLSVPLRVLSVRRGTWEPARYLHVEEDQERT